MALRDQPYMPLYVQDYLTDEKLNMCSLPTQGVYIKLICIMHKSNPYGVILLKQKDKQKENICLDFAYKIARLLPIDINDLYEAVKELVNEEVLIIENDKLIQRRMVRDNELSIKRANAGSKGGKKTQKFAKAKSKANTEDEYEYKDINSINIVFDEFWNLYAKKVGNKKACEKKWKKLSNKTRQKIMDTLPAFKRNIKDKQYLPYPQTYLNQERWNDEITDDMDEFYEKIGEANG